MAILTQPDDDGDQHPVAFENIDSLREWWELQLFSGTHHQWVEKTTFRRILRSLTSTELRELRTAGVIPEPGQ